MQFVNTFLNNTTMYRLMMYFLLFLVGAAVVLSAVSIIPFSPIDIAFTSFYLTLACKIINQVLAKIFKVGTNVESSIITGLILSLIVGPVNWIPAFAGMTKELVFLTLVAAFAMGSKYLFVYKKKHIFNPAAFGIVASALLLNQGASWWVGLPQLVPVTVIGGLLILKKIRRWETVITFLLGYLGILVVTTMLRGGDLVNAVISTISSTSLLFFALVMLVEPLTSPPTKMLRIYFAGIVVLVSFILQASDIYYNLELSLLIANIFTIVSSPQFRQTLKLKSKEEIAPGVIQFNFEPSSKFNFKPGQFLEWTLPHKKPDSRGIRRFFTISSSPTEDDVILTTKFYDKLSTFKQALHALEPGSEIIASSLSGEFTLPENRDQKLVFIAGGIGVTPFRSMVKWMIDQGEKRDIVLLYSNKTQKDIVFQDIFKLGENLGVRVVYVLTDEKPDNWKGRTGYVDEKMIREEVSDYKDRLFYISGPEPMVEAFEKMIAGMGVPKAQIKRDYFPGYTETHQK